MASGIGDVAGPVEARVPLTGASVVPPSPVQLRIERQGAAAQLRWARRSRAGWRWVDGSDVPLAEEQEAYRVTLSPPGGSATIIETTGPVLDPLPALPSGTDVAVRQRGTNGQSPSAVLVAG